MEEKKGFNFQRHRTYSSSWWTTAKYIFYLIAVLVLGYYYIKNYR